MNVTTFLIVCVWPSWRIDNLLSYYGILGFTPLLFKLQYYCMHPPVQYILIWFILAFKIYQYIYFLRQRHWRLGWLWNFIPTLMCKLCVCRIYSVSVLYGFIPLVNVLADLCFHIGSVDGGITAPLRAILCIVWNSWLIIGIIKFIHVVCVF